MMKEAIEELRQFKHHHCPHCMECWPSKPITEKNSMLYGKRDCVNSCGQVATQYQKSKNPQKQPPFLIYSKKNDAIPDPYPKNLPGLIFFFFSFLKYFKNMFQLIYRINFIRISINCTS